MFYFKNLFLLGIACTANLFCASDTKIKMTALERQVILDSLPKTRETVRERLNSEEWDLNPEFVSACMFLHVTRNGHETTIKLSPLDFVPEITTTHDHRLETILTYAEKKEDPEWSLFRFLHFFTDAKLSNFL